MSNSTIFRYEQVALLLESYLSAMLNTEIISLEHAPEAYATFSEGSPKKSVIDPHRSVK